VLVIYKKLRFLLKFSSNFFVDDFSLPPKHIILHFTIVQSPLPNDPLRWHGPDPLFLLHSPCSTRCRPRRISPGPRGASKVDCSSAAIVRHPPSYTSKHMKRASIPLDFVRIELKFAAGIKIGGGAER
jgi:hypothetical protein